MRSSSMALVCVAFMTSTAAADGTTTDGAPVAPAPNTPVVVAPAPAPLPAPDLGMHLRNGFSISAGQEFGSGPSSGFSGQLLGGDWRIGMRLNQDYSVYLDSHLSF